MKSASSERTPLLNSSAAGKEGNSSKSSRRVQFGHHDDENDNNNNDSSERSTLSSSSSRSKRLASFLQRMTRSERERALAKVGVGAAAFLIRDAVLSSEQVENPAQGAYDPYTTTTTTSSSSPQQDGNGTAWRNYGAILCSRWCAYRPLVQFVCLITWLLVLLTFCEPPHWCRQEDEEEDEDGGCAAIFALKGIPAADHSNSTNNKHAQAVQYYPNTRSMLVTAEESRIIEAVCVCLFFLYTLLRIGRDGMDVFHYLRPGKAFVIRTTQLVCLFLLTCGLISNVMVHHPYVRLVLLVTMMRTSHRNLAVLVKMVPNIVQILTLLVVFMIFYAWFGCIMFVATPEGRLHFSSLVESLWTLWICVTTANYPDVMMPAYNDNRWTALYFVSFMMLSFFFLMNVILAAVVNEYDNAAESQREERQQNCATNLKKAFRLMDVDKTGRIDRETVMALFTILNEDFPEFRTLSDEDTRLLFAILDKDGSSTITEDEFMDFGNVLLLEFTKTSDYATFVERRFPKVYQSSAYQHFCRIIKSDYFEYVIDFILVLNAAVIGIQSYPELTGQEVVLDKKFWDGSIDTVWELMESIFTVIYVQEVIVKLLVFGRKRYFESPKNIFDFTITIMAVVSSAIVYYPNQYSDSRLIRMIVMARVLRLIRLLTAMKPFQLIGEISVHILPKATGVVLVLFYLMYLFSALGMDLYGGLITRDPSNPRAYYLLDTDFSDNDYWANNFNDMLSSMNVLFNLLVVNNWTECEIGFEAATQAKWVRFFFLAFHILGVVLVNNLVIAFIINNFLQQLAIFEERTDAEIVGDGEAILYHRQAVFDASEVTGTRTSLSGAYIARIGRGITSHTSQAKEQDKLRQLFTRTSSNFESEHSDSGKAAGLA